ncbi:hypothetical protein ACP4OV_009444 [Aristida adscensionis]
MAATAASAVGGGDGRRYALLLALRDSEYARAAYGGYRNDSFRVVDGEFPAAEELAGYDGFVVTGSPNDAYGEDPWIRRLCTLIQAVHAMRKRILGVCFGHQVLCRALGGSVGKACSGWDVGVRKVTFVQDLEGFDFLPDLDELPPSASIIEVHQDEVWEIPAGARVIAYSKKTRVEAFAVGELALGVQGHPEYTTDILLNLVDRLLREGAIQGHVGDGARRTAAETGGPDRAFWTALCKGFLRGGGRQGGCHSRPPPAAPARETTTASPEVASHVATGGGGGCFAGAGAVLPLACGTARTSVNY